jgi:hypothetical protein
MVVLVDEDGAAPARRFKLAPPVAMSVASREGSPRLVGRARHASLTASVDGGGSITSFAL